MSKIKACKDCIYIDKYEESPRLSKCLKTRTKVIDYVNGTESFEYDHLNSVTFCSNVRKYGGLCGPDGSWFEERKTQ